ncbi:claw keratin [Anastrepha obliqua]|uniref:claw keratin n=1 Tax=Anastrepha obliqua TaxID=95512 RepID=UPI0024098469|nr:claw keratin [Anastrepha obliqua]
MREIAFVFLLLMACASAYPAEEKQTNEVVPESPQQVAEVGHKPETATDVVAPEASEVVEMPESDATSAQQLLDLDTGELANGEAATDLPQLRGGFGGFRRYPGYGRYGGFGGYGRYPYGGFGGGFGGFPYGGFGGFPFGGFNG